MLSITLRFTKFLLSLILLLYRRSILKSEDRIYIWVHADDTFTAATSTDLLDEYEHVTRDYCEE